MGSGGIGGGKRGGGKGRGGGKSWDWVGVNKDLGKKLLLF